MYCKYCGHEAGENKSVCAQCGAKLNEGPQVMSAPKVDTGSACWGVLGAFSPLAGFILFLVFKQEKPRTAKQAGIGAIIGVSLTVVMSILFVLLLIIIILVVLSVTGAWYTSAQPPDYAGGIEFARVMLML